MINLLGAYFINATVLKFWSHVQYKFPRKSNTKGHILKPSYSNGSFLSGILRGTCKLTWVNSTCKKMTSTLSKMHFYFLFKLALKKTNQITMQNGLWSTSETWIEHDRYILWSWNKHFRKNRYLLCYMINTQYANPKVAYVYQKD